MDRGCITYSACFLAGEYLGIYFTVPFPVAASIIILLFILSIQNKKNAATFIITTHMAIAVAGFSRYNLAESNQDLPDSNITLLISSKTDSIRKNTEEYLKKFCQTKENHGTLCALTLGSKDFMEKELKQSYSRAGAMHILALSGLHTGIIYTILGTLLSPLLLLPCGYIIKEILTLVLLVIYALVCGAPPSVVRACTMIIIYRIGIRSFRNVSKWDAIAVCAMATGILFPMQIGSIGFQLSYAAVFGISLLFPVCNGSFKNLMAGSKSIPPTLKHTIQKLWSNIALSVCCQITTLPLVLYHFGYSSSFFLITNLIAIPLATGILYLFVILMALQWLPFADEIIAPTLNFLITLMNGAVTYISN